MKDVCLDKIRASNFTLIVLLDSRLLNRKPFKPIASADARGESHPRAQPQSRLLASRRVDSFDRGSKYLT